VLDTSAFSKTRR